MWGVCAPLCPRSTSEQRTSKVSVCISAIRRPFPLWLVCIPTSESGAEYMYRPTQLSLAFCVSDTATLQLNERCLRRNATGVGRVTGNRNKAQRSCICGRRSVQVRRCIALVPRLGATFRGILNVTGVGDWYFSTTCLHDPTAVLSTDVGCSRLSVHTNP